jgi:hypothetical protein
LKKRRRLRGNSIKPDELLEKLAQAISQSSSSSVVLGVGEGLIVVVVVVVVVVVRSSSML